MPDHDGVPLTLGRSFWAIAPAALPRLIEAHRTRESLAPFAARFSAAVEEPSEQKSDRPGGAVAVLPLTGVLTPRVSLLSLLFGGGGSGLMEFRDNFRAAVKNPDIGTIVLDVDSPGGLIDLIPETAEEVRAARGTKPIVAVANTLAASAAYWIASQADEVVVTPSGSVGSIGVYMVHEDWSGWNEQKGVQPTYVSAGKYKIEGNPDEPLSDEAQADWQAEVRGLYDMFVTAVANGRGTTVEAVRDGYGEGRTVIANRAVGAGLADRIDTLDNVVADLLAREGSADASAATAAVRFSQITQFSQITHHPRCNERCEGDLHYFEGSGDPEGDVLYRGPADHLVDDDKSEVAADGILPFELEFVD